MPGGRPTKFTPERTEKLLQALRGGNYRDTACKYAGISHTTFHKWMKIGHSEGAPPEYVEFVEAVEKAEADAEVFDIALIRQAATGGNWQAAAWVRERKNPEKWGRRDASKVELTGADGGPVDVRVALGVDPAAIEGLASALAVRAASRAGELDADERAALGEGDAVGWLAGVVDAEVVEP